MSRLARESSWHLLAFVIVVAGLSVLAPITWWQAHEPRAIKKLARERRGEEGREPAFRPEEFDPLILTLEAPPRPFADAPQPELAPLRPLIADDITLDPSITEMPALPAATAVNDDPLLADATGDLRLSATLNRPSLPVLPEATDIEPLREPSQPPLGVPYSELGSNQLAAAAWPVATSLLEQLKALATAAPETADWAQLATTHLHRLATIPKLNDPLVAGELGALRGLADQAKSLAATIKEENVRSKVLRAGFAIVRRIVIWDQVHALATRGDVSVAPVVDRRAWHETISKVDELLHATGAAAHWRKYLQIDRACTEFDAVGRTSTEQRQLARDILHRIHSTQLSRAQENFLHTPPFAALDEQLHCRAAETPDLAALLEAIERFEHDDNAAAAQALAHEYDILRWSTNEEVAELADTINTYYRNANVRVAISSELANRMVPQQSPQVEPVEDNILGASVFGQSQTNAKVRVALVPDEHMWNIGLEAVGEVASNTASSKGPVTFYQNGWSLFRARKRITIDRRGIRVYSAQAEANANNDLEDFETDFDGIPLLGGLVRSIARNQYDSSQPAAKVEVEGRIIVRASSQLDQEVTKGLEKAKNDFQWKVIKPLRDLNLEPTAVDMQTTSERLIARYRLAARDQVAAPTPRPQAPGDSMLSVQIHESAFNNVLQELRFQGRRVELAELYKEMTGRFTPGKKIEIPEDLPENVFVTFADQDPIRVDCHDGHLQLTIRLKELAQAGTKNRWTNFTVHAFYVPSADQLDANLKREGIIELIGDNKPLPIGQRVALSGIFNRVLSKSRKLHIINRQIAEAPQLRDQQVTQFVIHDGWIGVALGPKAPGRQAAMFPRTGLKQE